MLFFEYLWNHSEFISANSYIFKVSDKSNRKRYCTKSVQIRSNFWSVVSCIRTEYGDYGVNLRIQSEYPVYGPEITPYLDTFRAWYGKTQVTSYELRVTRWKFKSTSWNSKVQVEIHELRVQIRELRVQIHKLLVRIHELPVRIHELRVQIHKLRVQIHESRVKIHWLRVQIHKLQFESTSYEFKFTRYEFESTSPRIIY